MKMKKCIIKCLEACLVVVAVTFGLTGCFFQTDKDDDMDDVAIALTENLDQDVLKYVGVSEYEEMYTYSFRLDPERVDEVGEETKKLYEALEKYLKSSDYVDKQICVEIQYKHYDHGVYCILASFRNCSLPVNKKDGPYDYVAYASIWGITDDADFYDKNAEYEVNQLSFWEFTSDVTNLRIDENIK